VKPRVQLPPFSTEAFATPIARAAGIGAKRLRGSDLQRPFRAVRIPSATLPSLAELCLAYQQRMPDHAFFCGPTAATLMGFPLPRRLQDSRILHVAVPSPHPRLAGRGIAGHTITAADADSTVRSGLRIGTPERTWFDLGAVLDLFDLVAASDFLIHWRDPLTSRYALAAAFARYSGRRGRRALRQALELMSDRAESPPESRTRVIFVLAGIQELAVNHPITTSAGQRYRADLAIPGLRVLIEYQGDYHRRPQQFRDDMTRRSRLEADGWYVFLINAADLDDPGELVARLRRVLLKRSRLFPLP
jgi:hypothetical protein